jgi:hypothetical protein
MKGNSNLLRGPVMSVSPDQPKFTVQVDGAREIEVFLPNDESWPVIEKALIARKRFPDVEIKRRGLSYFVTLHAGSVTLESICWLSSTQLKETA